MKDKINQFNDYKKCRILSNLTKIKPYENNLGAYSLKKLNESKK
jgi:hypothetical protein